MKISKRIIAILLITALCAPFVNLTEVFAGAQVPVTGFRIGRSSGDGGTHDVLLSWNPLGAPSITSADAPANLAPINAPYFQYGAAAYDLEYFNATRNTPVERPAPPVPPNVVHPLTGVGPIKGSLYSFKLIPYHFHSRTVTVNNIVETYYDVKVTPAANSIMEALLLTDIEVEGIGANNSITITWDNPNYRGTNVFPWYKIYLKEGTTGAKSNPMQVLDVNVNQLTAIQANPATGKGPRFSYTINDPQIQPGIFSVAVEPCNAARQAIRDLPGVTDNTVISFGGVDRSIAFTPSTALEYGSNQINVILDLTLDEVANNSWLLNWVMPSTQGRVVEIAIFMNNSEGAVANELRRYLDPTSVPAAHPSATITGTAAATMSSYPIVPPKLGDMPVYYAIGYKIEENNETFVNVSEILPVFPAQPEIIPNKPNIYLGNANVSGGINIPVYWDVFQRESYFGAQATDTVKNVTIDGRSFSYDYAVLYDIKVTDDFNALDTAADLVSNATDQYLGGVVGGTQGYPANAQGKPLYKMDISRYWNGSAYVPMATNKLYYISVSAKKEKSGAAGSVTYTPDPPNPAYIAVYVPTTGNISSPSLIQKTPFEVKKDADGNQEITTTSVTVTWRDIWTEVYKTDTWFTKAVVKPDGTIDYGKEIVMNNDVFVDFSGMTPTDAKDTLNGLNEPADMPVRTVDNTGANYEFKVMDYKTFLGHVDENNPDGFNKYSTSDEFINSTGWLSETAVNMQYDGDRPYATIGGLVANSTYAVLIRPFRMVDGAKKPGYANFLIVTTAPVERPLDVTPTTPIVHIVPDSITDTKVSIRWESNPSFEYEVLYSTIYINDMDDRYPPGANVLPLGYTYANVTDLSAEQLGSVADPNKTDKDVDPNKTYRTLEIDGLFPETQYHFWVRAKAQGYRSNGTPVDRFSNWSNPASATTEDLETPMPPKGFGLASLDDINKINLQNASEYVVRDKNYIIMQWFKDLRDDKTTGNGTSTDVATILTEPTITDSYIAQFAGLISNKPYYFRAKTIVTVQLNAQGKSYFTHSYLIQISEDADFVEMREIYVPAQTAVGGPLTYKQKESEWTATINFKTITSDDDYDTEVDMDTIILPEQDFEITFNGLTSTLTYRFRTDEKDAYGNYDNRVDQRLISTLVKKGVHDYNIDVSKYENNIIRNRVVEVPYTLIKTFEERKINFGITAAGVTVAIPPGATSIPVVNNLKDYGDKAKLYVAFAENPPNMPPIGIKDSYAVNPQLVTMSVITPTQTVTIPYTAKPLEIKLTLNNRAATVDSNVGAYVNNEQTAGWSLVSSKYNKEKGQLEIKSHPGMFTAIAKGAPDTVLMDNTTTSMLNVAASLNITDMPIYNGNARATSNQVINIMSALVAGKKQVALNQTPDPTIVSSLQKAGMFINSGAPTVSREQAIASMVRLYELKTKQQIRPTYTTATTPYRDTVNASVQYQAALLKAAEIDMLNGAGSVRPKDSLSLGELFGLAEVVILDAGL